MFGVSFLEIAVVALVALIVVGPQKLPAMMRQAGEWMAKLRRLTSDVRKQTGIDEILREEGIDGVNELRSLLRGQYAIRPQARSGAAWSTSAAASSSASWSQSSGPIAVDLLVEFPTEGVDCASALPDDLIIDYPPLSQSPAAAQLPGAEAPPLQSDVEPVQEEAQGQDVQQVTGDPSLLVAAETSDLNIKDPGATP